MNIFQYSIFWLSHVLSPVLNLISFFSDWRLGGSCLYHLTEAQNQLVLVRSSSGIYTEGCYVTPTAARAAVVSAAFLVLYCWYPEITF